MSGDQLDALPGDLVGDCHRLLRIAGVVADFQHQLLAEHAAGLVDVGDRLLGARLELRAEGGVLAGHRPDDGDRYIGARRGGRPRREGGGGNEHGCE